MCTVSVVPLWDGFRLVCNRDERRSRPVALPPRRAFVNGVAATFPVDPQSGGTWIGVTDSGLTAALLNRSPRAGNRTAVRSRGDIIPRVLCASDLTQVVQALCRIDPAAYDPFEVVATGHGEIVAAVSLRGRLHVTRRRLTAPAVFTSSSAGDAEAERLRLPLFDALVVSASDPLTGQRAFHDHFWPECGAFSVRMCRFDARTVSRSIVDVRGGASTFEYEVLPGA